jgi:hypothetical protein
MKLLNRASATLAIDQVTATVVPGFTTSGPAVISLGSVTMALDALKRDGTVGHWAVNCTLKVSNPAQSRAFSPGIGAF